jgi:hypothetical protein
MDFAKEKRSIESSYRAFVSWFMCSWYKVVGAFEFQVWGNG